MDKTAKRILERAGTRMLLSAPFYGTLFLYLKRVETDRVPRLATDGKHLYYNPKFVIDLDKENPDFVVGGCVHETMHCALKHMTRRQARNPKKWGWACDYAINPSIIADGFKLPSWVLNLPEYAGMSAEAIYNRIPDPPVIFSGGSGGKQKGPGGKQKGQGQGKGKGDGDDDQSDNDQSGGNKPDWDNDPRNKGEIGGVMDAADPFDKETQEEVEVMWDRAVRQAVAVGKRAGRLPHGANILIDQLQESKVRWQDLLRQWADSAIRRDTSWSRPNRRFLDKDYIMPSLSTIEQLTHLGVLADTSGSVQFILKDFASEINAILMEGNFEKMTKMDVDAKFQGYKEFYSGDTMNFMEFRGGGGTVFEEAFDWIAYNLESPSGLIVLTDMFIFDLPKLKDPGCPVLWCIYAQDEGSYNRLAAEAPFGTCIFVREGQST